MPLLARILIAAVMTCVAAQPALADMMYRGRTSQHYRASMRVLGDGTIARIRLRHRSRCTGRGYWAGPIRESFINGARDPIVRHGRRFHDGPSRDVEREGKLRHVLRGSIRGRFLRHRRVTAVFHFHSRTYRRKKLIDTCHAKVRLKLKRVSS